jgi:hypothetical protein
MATRFALSDLTVVLHATEMRSSMSADSNRELLGPLSQIPLLALGAIADLGLTLPDAGVKLPDGFRWISDLLPPSSLTLRVLGIAALLLFLNRALAFGTRYRSARYVAFLKSCDCTQSMPSCGGCGRERCCRSVPVPRGVTDCSDCTCNRDRANEAKGMKASDRVLLVAVLSTPRGEGR